MKFSRTLGRLCVSNLNMLRGRYNGFFNDTRLQVHSMLRTRLSILILSRHCAGKEYNVFTLYSLNLRHELLEPKRYVITVSFPIDGRSRLSYRCFQLLLSYLIICKKVCNHNYTLNVNKVKMYVVT